jgi:hypothetical protein
MKTHLPLRKSLFWEIDRGKIDYRKDKKFIIGRVLDFGNLKEWKAIKDFYGFAEVKKAAQEHIFYDPRSANFWEMVLGLPSKKLQCTKRLSLKTPKAFSAR